MKRANAHRSNATAPSWVAFPIGTQGSAGRRKS